MSSISLYIAPFALETPYEVPISPKAPRKPPHDCVTERIDKLVGKLQLRASSDPLAIPPEVSLDLIPAPGRSWVLYCLTRRTIIPAQVVNDLCKALANDTSSTTTVGKFIVLPIPKTYISSGTLLDTLSIRILPSQSSLAHTTHQKYLKSIPRCWYCMFVSGVSRCSSCVEEANSVFHINQVTCPAWNRTKAKSYIHLGLWIPHIAAPCDLIWNFLRDDPISKISAIIGCLQPKTKSDASKHEIHSWGDYPTEENNWILLDFATGKLLDKEDFPDLQEQSKLEGQSKTYAVIPAHCGPRAVDMLKAVQKDGSVGWENFWQERMRTSVSGGDGDDGISTPGLRTPPTPDHSPNYSDKIDTDIARIRKSFRRI